MKGNIVLCGCTYTGIELMRNLLKCGIQIDYVVTISPKKAEQAQVSGYVDYTIFAKNHKIPVYVAENYSLKSKNDLQFFSTNKFDLLITGGWQRLIPYDVLSNLRIGGVGLHGSSEFLPKGRGRSPINWSLIQGKKRFLLHYFLMKEGVDNGDIFYIDTFDINDWDTCDTLYKKLILSQEQTLIEWIPKLLMNNFETFKQLGEPSYYPKRNPKDGIIDWSKTVFEIYDFVRALTKPYPGAFSFIGERKIMIWKAQPFDTRLSYFGKKEGEIVKVFDDMSFVVNCNSGLLLVTDYDGNILNGEIFG